MNKGTGSRSYPLASFVAATVSRQLSPVRRLAIRSVLSAVLGGVDCAIYSVASVMFLTLGALFLIVESQAAVLGLFSLSAGVVSGILVAVRVVSVYRALQIGDAVEVEITRSDVGLMRLTGTLWGDLINGTAVRGSYQIPGVDAVADYYLQERWARSLRPGMKIWVISVNGRPVLFAPSTQFDH
jgi:hypothetical protein